MKSIWKPVGRVVLAAALMILTACDAADGPMTPVDQTGSPQMASGIQLVPVRQGRSLEPAGTLLRRVSALVGAVLKTDDVRLAIKPLSMSYSATITIEPMNDGSVSFRFGPGGLRFNPAARLTISADKANLDGIDPGDLKIAGASDSADDWQIIEESIYDPLTNSVTGPVSHFSRYALCVDR
ncbi:MAG: hypothetical protein H0W36_05335 [Gemmatimonadetes bacterium]|nr:hypothetical protein [Gemmatimonadota bacterium]